MNTKNPPGPSDSPPLTHADLHAARQAMATGTTSATQLLDEAIARASSAACSHVFLSTAFESARAQAQGAQASQPLAGLAVSVKDLFDIAGQPTAAGSTVLAETAPALADAPAVARLKAAGGVVIGRTNMSEFAFSGVGWNPHHGTPVNPADTLTPRIPGGSSSGAAVSVASGAAWIGLGSDTGGSIRIPAALCGIVGFKPTARLVPTEGAVPLSTTLDTVCALTHSVRDAVLVHEILSATHVPAPSRALGDFRFAVARTSMLEGMDEGVERAFWRAVDRLRSAGAHIDEIDLPGIADLGQIQAKGGFAAAEAWAWHRHLLADQAARYDQRVAARILRGAAMSAADYIDLLHARRTWIARLNSELRDHDAVLSPTVPIVAPPIASIERDDDEFFRVNALLLRNTSVVNMLDGCAISIPCHAPGELPVGLMVWAGALRDDVVLHAARLFEDALRETRAGT